MKKFIISIFTLLLGFSFLGCKKYDENEGILSLRTVNARLTNGDWGLTKLTIDGVDSTFEYKEVDFLIYFTKDRNAFDESLHSYYLEYTQFGTLQVISGRVAFSDKGEKMTFTDGDNFGFGNTGNLVPLVFDNSFSNRLTWTVTKLTNKEMKLNASKNGIKYEWILFKI